MSLSVSHVSKFYGKQEALHEVCFELRDGEICGFLGPNGAGKSTLMKIITGYTDDFTGEVVVNGEDVRLHPLRTKATVGYLPEHNPLYTDMYIPEYLLHVARLYGMSDPMRRVERIMERTGLAPERKKKIGRLSKGYRQRTGLAQALIHDPELLVLDEPMTGLDPNQLAEIRELILQIGQDKTILLSTHVMQEVEAICGRILFIDKGHLIADKSKQDFRATPSGEMAWRVRFAPGSLVGGADWIHGVEGVSQVERDGDDTFRVVATSGDDPRIALFQAAASRHCPIIDLREASGIEETFRELAKKHSSDGGD